MNDTRATWVALIGRLRNEGPVQYLSLASIVKAIALANGASVAVSLADRHPLHINNMVECYLELINSFIAVAITYFGTSSGILFMVSSVSVVDVVLPTLVAASEYVQFRVIALESVPHLNHNPVSLWFIVYGIWAALASLTVWHVRRQTVLDNYEQRLYSTVRLLRAQLRSDALFAFLTAIAAEGNGLVIIETRINTSDVCIVLGLSVTVGVVALMIQSHERKILIGRLLKT